MLMSTGALTSGCSRTRTWCEPSVLIGARTSIRRRASSGWLALAGYDVDVDRGADVGVQPDADLVRAERLDRVADLDPAPVELGTACLADRLGDIGGPA